MTFIKKLLDRDGNMIDSCRYFKSFRLASISACTALNAGRLSMGLCSKSFAHLTDEFDDDLPSAVLAGSVETVVGVSQLVEIGILALGGTSTRPGAGRKSAPTVHGCQQRQTRRPADRAA